MRLKGAVTAGLITWVIAVAAGGERPVVALKEFSGEELKSTGIEVRRTTVFHVKALGGGGDYGWTYRSDRMFAYAWIINADTRRLVWKMTPNNTRRLREDREFDGSVSLDPGSYEIYFAAYAFAYHTAFTHIVVNIDRREQPLFGSARRGRDFFSWFKSWWSDDIKTEWEKRSKNWGIEMSVDDDAVSSISFFSPPRPMPNSVFKAVRLGENEHIVQGISVTSPTSLGIYAIGEGRPGRDLVDFGWIIDLRDRNRVWEMSGKNTTPAGGAEKNVQFSGTIDLDKGEYALYYFTDGNHSAVDWNEEPPNDPLNWGITLTVQGENERKNVKLVPYKEDQNIILALTKVGDNENRSEGFTLKKDSKLRVYAIGERSNSRRLMADYGFIMDVKTRNKVWTMDVDRTAHAGGASKNRYIDEVITLPRGSYIVNYVTDDSHAFGEWNDDPPFDQDHYGISVMGVGDQFNPAIVAKYVEERDKNIIAQITRVGDDADRSENFLLERTTRVRVYAIGEGQNREMFDYGWIEDAKTGKNVWEMTYPMTFHAGGGRKNRMINTTILLDKGSYLLRFRSDDSHSYGDWNVEPPDDQQYWGITLYRDEESEQPPVPPHSPAVLPPPKNRK